MSEAVNDTCKHFGGCRPPVCDAGVNIREVTGGPQDGWLIRIPCCSTPEIRGGKPVPRAACEKFCLPTDEEFAASERETFDLIEASRRMMQKASEFFGRVRTENRGRSASGTDPCPACPNGTLRWSIAAYNGHIHARCSTPGCISFMQ